MREAQDGGGSCAFSGAADQRDGIGEKRGDGFVAGAQVFKRAGLLRIEAWVFDAGELQEIDAACRAQLFDAREREAVEADFEIAERGPVGEPVAGRGATLEIADPGALFGPGLREGFDEEAQQGEHSADEAGRRRSLLMRSVCHGRHYAPGRMPG